MRCPNCGSTDAYAYSQGDSGEYAFTACGACEEEYSDPALESEGQGS